MLDFLKTVGAMILGKAKLQVDLARAYNAVAMGDWQHGRTILSQIGSTDAQIMAEVKALTAQSYIKEAEEVFAQQHYADAEAAYLEAMHLQTGLVEDPLQVLVRRMIRLEITDQAVVPYLERALREGALWRPEPEHPISFLDLQIYAGLLFATHGYSGPEQQFVIQLAFMAKEKEARGQHRDGNPARALAIMEHLVGIGGSPAIRLRTAILLLNAGRPGEAADLLAAVPVADYPNPAQAVNVMMRAHWQAGRPEAALAAAQHPAADEATRAIGALLEAVVAGEPHGPSSSGSAPVGETAYVRAVLAVRQGHATEGLALLERAPAALNAGLAGVFRAALLLHAGDTAGAEKALSQVNARSDLTPLTSALQGLIAARKGEFESALRHWATPAVGALTEEITPWVRAAEAASLLRQYAAGSYSAVLEQAARGQSAATTLSARLQALSAYRLATAAARAGKAAEAAAWGEKLALLGSNPRVVLVRAIVALAAGQPDVDVPEIADAPLDLQSIASHLRVEVALRQGDFAAAQAQLDLWSRSDTVVGRRESLQAWLFLLQGKLRPAYLLARRGALGPQLLAGTGLFLEAIPCSHEQAAHLANSAVAWAHLWNQIDPQRTGALLDELAENEGEDGSWQDARAHLLLIEAHTAYEAGGDPTEQTDVIIESDASPALIAEAANLEGVYLMDQGDFSEAAASFEDAWEAHEEGPEELLLHLALAYEREEDPASAANHWQALLEVWADAPPPVQGEEYGRLRTLLAARRGGQQALADEDWGLAMKMADAGLKVEKTNLPLTLLKQMALCKSGQVDKGLRVLDAYAKQTSDPVPVLCEKVLALWTYKGVPVALDLLVELRAKYPDRGEVGRTLHDARNVLEGWVDDFLNAENDRAKNLTAAANAITELMKLADDAEDRARYLYRRALIVSGLAFEKEDHDLLRLAEEDVATAFPQFVQPDHREKAEKLRSEIREMRVRVLAGSLLDRWNEASAAFTALLKKLDEASRRDVDTTKLLALLKQYSEWFNEIRSGAKEGQELAKTVVLKDLPFVELQRRCVTALDTIRDIERRC